MHPLKEGVDIQGIHKIIFGYGDVLKYKVFGCKVGQLDIKFVEE
jgi:hypothetical protein